MFGLTRRDAFADAFTCHRQVDRLFVDVRRDLSTSPTDHGFPSSDAHATAIGPPFCILEQRIPPPPLLDVERVTAHHVTTA